MKRIQTDFRRTWARTKSSLEWHLAKLFDSVALLGNKQPRRSGIALLHVELLGDLYIWLPYAKHAVAGLQQRGAGQPILVYNAAWNSIVENEVPDAELIGVDLKRFRRAPRYRFATLRKLRARGVHTILCMDYPRDGLVHDAIVRALSATQSWGHAAGYADRSSRNMAQANRLFTHLLPNAEGLHRSERHAKLLAAAGIAPPLKPARLTPCTPPLPMPEKYLVISPGASYGAKAWPGSNFERLASRMLAAFHDLHCVFTGAPFEAGAINAMSTRLGSRASSIAGRNTLPQLQDCIAGAAAVLANDSAAVHIAAACSVPSVAVIGGATWGVCLPYPANSSVFPVQPRLAFTSMDCYGCASRCVFQTSKDSPTPCIQAVSIEQVETMLIPILAQRLAVSPNYRSLRASANRDDIRPQGPAMA